MEGIYYLTVLRTTSPTSRCWQGHAPSAGSRGASAVCLSLSSWHCWQHLALDGLQMQMQHSDVCLCRHRHPPWGCPHMVFTPHGSCLRVLFLQRYHPIALGSHLLQDDLILTACICSSPIFKSNPIMRFWGGYEFLGDFLVHLDSLNYPLFTIPVSTPGYFTSAPIFLVHLAIGIYSIKSSLDTTSLYVFPVSPGCFPALSPLRFQIRSEHVAATEWSL